MSPSKPLDAETLRAALGDQLIGRQIVVREETTSSNDIVAQMAADHTEGLVVVAEKQTAGRGQYGRRWESASRKGLWLSVLLRPAIAITDSARLTNLLAATISKTIMETVGLEAAIKPPNDVYIDERKVAGVLVEMRVEANGKHCAIAGLGVNVNHTLEDFPPELRATAGSLAMSVDCPPSRFDFLIALLRNLDRRYAELRE